MVRTRRLQLFGLVSFQLSYHIHYLIIALQDTNGDTSWNCGALASALGTTSYIGRGGERYDTRTTTSEWVGQLS
jgi:hypothetical protein